ncbi:hypothetical protein [Amycolatopsis circi]|uniref:hypothetical protein n=1 Tax=Amycolatopsis circi TaxID=871959 RepID=UPI001FC9B47B|nr:hypothetical protein [Amycolatopsis circi]
MDQPVLGTRLHGGVPFAKQIGEAMFGSRDLRYTSGGLGEVVVGAMQHDVFDRIVEPIGAWASVSIAPSAVQGLDSFAETGQHALPVHEGFQRAALHVFHHSDVTDDLGTMRRARP